MTAEERQLLNKAMDEIQRLTQVNEQLIFILKGGMGMPGLIDQLKTAEHERKQQVERDSFIRDKWIEENEAFKEFFYRNMDGAEGELNRKFEYLSEKIDIKLNEDKKFKAELYQFKNKLEMYMGVITGLTNKSTWLFLLKLIGIVLTVGFSLMTFYKLGYELIMEVLHKLNKIKT